MCISLDIFTFGTAVKHLPNAPNLGEIDESEVKKIDPESEPIKEPAENVRQQTEALLESIKSLPQDQIEAIKRQIYKDFCQDLIKEEEGVYHSPNNKDRYYFVIPKHIDWEEFRELTKDVKNNVSVTGFDVAKGIFYENDSITEMVRIIRPDLTIDMVDEVKDKYLDRLS